MPLHFNYFLNSLRKIFFFTPITEDINCTFPVLNSLFINIVKMGTEDVAKVEESSQISDLEQKIIRQVEYYFGNFNLSKDKFLREQIKLDDGWVPMDTMILFKRLKSLSEDYKVICGALKKSPNQLMEVDEECTKIRRSVEKPLPDASKEVQEERTLYVKGFKKTSTLDELLEFFKEYKAEHITMRRRKLQKDTPFKGSCFVLFETKEDADKFLANKGLKYENTELLKETRKDYIKRKDVFFENLKAERQKKEAEKGNKESKDGDEEASTEKNKDTETKDSSLSFIPGCLIKIVGLGNTCLREDIKEVFEKYGPVVYVDYSKGQPEAVVRFETGIAATVMEQISEEDGEKKIEICSAKVTLSLIEGDADEQYWKDIAINRAKARKNFSQKYNKSGKGRFNNQNWGKGKKHNRDGDRGDERPSKKQKVDSNQEPKEQSNGGRKEATMEQE
ncbi:hypothetical protein JTE90_017764 [Oedothorax gibbosus]|uniref:Lupus La protein n=1 Tax=Oedothorax gibbosus TaxID=931172 RepID=A0AAV6UKV7_9ARAC|nr:hypothetical protein JTE90_017764 [Oedothorax gibbosus]